VVRSEPAFTLLELLVVLMLTGIIAAVVIPAASSTEDAQVAGAARILTTDLETAQALALAQQAETALVFNETLTSYKVVLAAGQNLSNYSSLVAVADPMQPGNTYEVVVAQMNTPLVAVNSAFGAANCITFDSFGSPALGGAVVLTARDATVTVSVEAITGAVSVN
jgi:prepilin-type N-terminal cleavage/methylation domain-containing protein